MKKLVLLSFFILLPLSAIAGEDICIDSNGNFTAPVCSSSGALKVSGNYAEDAAHSSGDLGVPSLAVRDDTTVLSLAGTNGDYAPLKVDALGRLITSDNMLSALYKVEDQAESASFYGFPPLSARRDTAASSAGTSGDWATINTDSAGALWTDAISRGDQIADADDAPVVKHAAINVDGADSDALVAAVASKKIKVLGYVIICDGATTITFEDGTDGDDFTGAMPLAANSGISAAVSPLGYFETDTVNRALNLLKSAAVNCDGHLTYVEVD